MKNEPTPFICSNFHVMLRMHKYQKLVRVKGINCINKSKSLLFDLENGQWWKNASFVIGGSNWATYQRSPSINGTGVFYFFISHLYFPVLIFACLLTFVQICKLYYIQMGGWRILLFFFHTKPKSFKIKAQNDLRLKPMLSILLKTSLILCLNCFELINC